MIITDIELIISLWLTTTRGWICLILQSLWFSPHDLVLRSCLWYLLPVAPKHHVGRVEGWASVLHEHWLSAHFQWMTDTHLPGLQCWLRSSAVGTDACFGGSSSSSLGKLKCFGNLSCKGLRDLVSFPSKFLDLLESAIWTQWVRQTQEFRWQITYGGKKTNFLDEPRLFNQGTLKITVEIRGI